MMSFYRKFAPWILLGLFALIFLELVLMVPDKLNQKAPIETTRSETKELIPVTSLQESLGGEVSQTMQGVHVVETKNAKREWELWSDIASTYKETGDLALQTVKTKFFGQDDIYFLVEGNSGSVISKSKNMYIKGAVQTLSSNGYKFTTEEIKYDSGQRELVSDSEVNIVGPEKDSDERLFLRGNNMRADLQSSTIKVEGDVRARKGLQAKEKKTINIRSEQALLSAQSNEVSFSGQVFINIQGMKISGNSAKFFYKSDSGQIAAIELDGGVKVSDYEKWATSEKVRIDLDKDLYVFKGAPKVVQDNDELFGDEIIFQDGGKKVKVKNARVKVSNENLQLKE